MSTYQKNRDIFKKVYENVQPFYIINLARNLLIFECAKIGSFPRSLLENLYVFSTSKIDH